MFPLNLPILVQDVLVAAFFLLAIVVFIRRHRYAKSDQSPVCRACGMNRTETPATKL